MLLHDDLRDSFEIVDDKKVSNTIIITLEEHDRIMHLEAGHEYEKNGFYEAKCVEDYTISSSWVVLLVKRWRWIERTTGRNVGNEYDTVVHGTRMSKGLALFSKDYLDGHPVPAMAVAEHYVMDGERLEH